MTALRAAASQLLPQGRSIRTLARPNTLAKRIKGMGSHSHSQSVASNASAFATLRTRCVLLSRVRKCMQFLADGGLTAATLVSAKSPSGLQWCPTLGSSPSPLMQQPYVKQPTLPSYALDKEMARKQ